MPIKSCTLSSGKYGYQWGDHGTCYSDRKDAEKQAEAAHANGYVGDKANIAIADMAFDKSVRHFDIDGRMHVDVSHISKAMVCPYLGSEIPDHERLGLDAGKVYMLLRDPKELEKAADTFKNLPLLIQHVPVNADEPRRDLIVGTVGTDIKYIHPYLSGSLSIWDSEAIAGIETKEQAELSSAYRYTPDMTPGVYEGVEYHGIMRDIIGNHVALVDVGRAGSDVVVADSNPFKGNSMKRTQRLIAAKVNARKALGSLIAQDSDLSDFDKFLDTVIAQDEKETKEEAKRELAEDETDDDLYEDDPENEGKRRKKVVAAADAEEEMKPEMKKAEVTKGAMDKAIATAVAAATSKVKKDMEALHVARKDVSSLVGEVALDSAEAVYKFALDHAGIDTEGVHSSAYRAMVKMVNTPKAPAVTFGMDSASVKKTDEQFPMLKRFGHA